jgi:Na+-translocating ferredoxin:NAD+ oxidoreductase RNF subunit RnfB
MPVAAILDSALILGGVGAVFGGLIATANRRFRVVEDPRIDAVEGLLPGTNCGACGTPGCRAFAEALVAADREPAGCTVMGPEEREDVASYLGVAAGEAAQVLARLLCAGGSEVARQQAEYQGHPSCQAAAVVSGGGKSCTWGCLGLADCERACTFDAIFMSPDGLPVVIPERCTACGDCVDVCPKDLFVLMPAAQKLIVQCRSLIEGDDALEHCGVACTGCGLCAKDAPDGAIEIRDGLAVVDYAHDPPAGLESIRRCPTQAIVWVEDAQFPGHTAPAGRIAV